MSISGKPFLFFFMLPCKRPIKVICDKNTQELKVRKTCRREQQNQRRDKPVIRFWQVSEEGTDVVRLYRKTIRKYI